MEQQQYLAASFEEVCDLGHGHKVSDVGPARGRRAPVDPQVSLLENAAQLVITYRLLSTRARSCSLRIVKGIVFSSFMEYFISRQTNPNLWFFSTSGTGNALNYSNLMHQIHRLITVAQLHV